MQRKIDLYATQRLVELLSNIEHQIAYQLNESIRYRHSFPISYLDFGSTNDTISFITSNKYDDIQRNNQDEWNSMVWKEKRSEMKIGKLIKMFYHNSFPVNHSKGQPIPKPQMDIESFVNKFKAERDKDVNYERFEIVKGTKFQYWYSQDNYSRFVHEETTLGRSCLRYKESANYLKLYSKNPEVFSMLILKDDANKLRGRANLWQLEEPKGRIYMDRIYSVNDYDVELFKDYAKQQGWLHKESQTYGWQNNIVDTKNGEVYKWNDMILLTKIKKVPEVDYDYYPYLDTLSIYNTVKHTLTNDGRLRVLEPHLLLTDYQGSFHSEIDGRDMVLSAVYNEYIVRDESKFVEIDNTWVRENEAVYVHNSGGKYAYKYSEKVVESNIYKRKYFLKEVTEFSEYLGTHIHKDSVRIAYLDEDKKEKVKIHYKMIGREFEEKGDFIIKKKCSHDQDLFTKYSDNDREMVEEILRHLSSNSPTQSRRRGSINRRGRETNAWGDDLDLFVDAPERPQVDSNVEEDVDPLASIGIDRYSPEVQQYLYELLEQQRRSRSEGRVGYGTPLDELLNQADTYEPRFSGLRFTPMVDRPMVTEEPIDDVATDEEISELEREIEDTISDPDSPGYTGQIDETENTNSNDASERYRTYNGGDIVQHWWHHPVGSSRNNDTISFDIESILGSNIYYTDEPRSTRNENADNEEDRPNSES